MSNSHNNYHGIVRLHQGKVREFCFLEMLGTLSYPADNHNSVAKTHISSAVTQPNVVLCRTTKNGNLTYLSHADINYFLLQCSATCCKSR